MTISLCALTYEIGHPVHSGVANIPWILPSSQGWCCVLHSWLTLVLALHKRKTEVRRDKVLVMSVVLAIIKVRSLEKWDFTMVNAFL